MGDILAPWMPLYAIGIQSSMDTAVAATDGIDADRGGVLLVEHAEFSPGQIIHEEKKLSGESYRQARTGHDYNMGGIDPKTTFPINGSAWNFWSFLWALFQTGSREEAADPYVKQFFHYDSAVMETWLTLVRYMGSGAVSHRLVGAIANQLTLSSDGTMLRGSAEMMAYDHETDHTMSAAEKLFGEHAELVWENATVMLNNDTIDLNGFEIVIPTNKTGPRYNHQNPQKFIQGDLKDMTGTITIPWDSGDTDWDGNVPMTTMKAGTTAVLKIYWGSAPVAAASGELGIICGVKFKDASTEELEGELGWTLPFDLVSGYEYTTGTGTIETTADSAVVSATGTAWDENVHPGDKFVLTDGADAGDHFIKTVDSATQVTLLRALTATDDDCNYRIENSPIFITLADGISRGIGL